MLSVLLIVWLTGWWMQTPGSQTGYVSFCEMVRNPERYDGKLVITAGVMTWGAESSGFQDPQCAPGPELDVATFPIPANDSVMESAGWQRMAEVLKRDRRAFVVIRTTFDAANRYDGPLPADPELQQMLKKVASRFGHMGFARFQLRVEAVEFVAPLADETR